MTNFDVEYLSLVEDILENGTIREDRTGTGTRSLFGKQLRFNLRYGFPLLTTKRVPFRIVAEELLWFISGSTNVSDLAHKDVHIWDDDAYRDFKIRIEQQGRYGDGKIDKETFIKELPTKGHDLGPVYGKQWRDWTKITQTYDIKSIDQLQAVIDSIKTNPYSRRHVVSAWNVADLEDMALPPCHILYQFYVSEGKLSCHMTQRSADVFLGLPFNIASYALLTEIIAELTGLAVGELIISIGDAHIYENHIEQSMEQLARKPYAPPLLLITKSIKDIDSVTMDHFQVVGYHSHPTIKAPLSVGLGE